MLYNIQTS